MMDAYREMLTYIKSAVTRNYSEKCINNIMDFVSGSASQNFTLLQEFYQTTLKVLEEAKNEVRFVALYEKKNYMRKKIMCWTVLYTFFICCAEVMVQDKLEALQDLVWYGRIRSHEQGPWITSFVVFDAISLPVILNCIIKLHSYWQILKELHKSCQREDGSDDQKKGTQLLEVYAIEIQMYTETKNNKKLKVRHPCLPICKWLFGG